MSVWNLGAGKKVTVSSVVYNMAGPEADRPDFLKTTVLSKIMAADNPMGMGEHIVDCYLRSAGIRLRNFSRWVERVGYDDVLGMPPGGITVGNALDPEVLAEEIPHPPDQVVQLHSASIGVADYGYWADAYVLEHHPEQVHNEYVTNFDLESNTISFVFPGGVTDSFHPAGYDSNSLYIYATYALLAEGVAGPLVPGDEVELAPGAPFPPVSGWTVNSYSSVPTTLSLATTVTTLVTYSDGRPDEGDTVVSHEDGTYDEIAAEYETTDYMGKHPAKDAFYSLRQVMTQEQTGAVAEDDPVFESVEEDIGGGVTRTTETTTVSEVIVVTRSYRIDEQELIHQEWGPLTGFIYEQGSGNPTLDAMFTAPQDVGAFFPPIPLRVQNRMVGEDWKEDVYPLSVKAMKKATSGDYHEVQDTIADNPQLGDIDYAYVCFGVSLNTKENASLRYVYEMLQEILLAGGGGAGGMEAFQEAYDEAEASAQAFADWKAAQSDPGNPLFGTPKPPLRPYPAPPGSTLTVATSLNNDLAFNMTVSWLGLREEIGSGLGKPDAKVGEFWFEKRGKTTYRMFITDVDGTPIPSFPAEVEVVALRWQVDESTWRTIEAYGLVHLNKVYGSETIVTTAFEALDDGDESGFIMPLQSELYRRMPLVKGTQMATACVYLVFNCVTVVKEKWYQTTAFKVLIVIVAIVITILTAGAGGAAAGGLLGANAAVGAAIGFTGIAAVIAGAVANALAAIILTQIISRLSVMAFGEKIGLIVGVVASIVALQVGTALASGASLTSAVTSLMDAQNLMRLTTAAGDGYARFLQAESGDMAAKYQQAMQEYADQARELDEKFQRDLVQDRPYLDPLTLTEVMSTNVPESSTTFLTRTLLTGTDIAGISLDMVSNFVDLTVSTRLPLP